MPTLPTMPTLTGGTRYAQISTTIGSITVVARDAAVIGVYFPGHWYRPNAGTFGASVEATNDPLFRLAERQINEYLAGERQEFSVPTAIAGDDFQERVWNLIRQIPLGETATYGDLARALGGNHLARDVGQAVGRNPLCIIVPCHRVVGKDGKLTGYAGRLARKQTLLELEGHLIEGQGGQATLRHAVQQAMPLLVAGAL